MLGNGPIQEDDLVNPMQKGQKLQSLHTIYKSRPGPMQKGDPILERGGGGQCDK